MKISVITICLNSSATIEDAVKSVLSQDHPQVEYIVIDGGSTDGTLEILHSYEQQIDLLVSEKDKGIYDALNKGIGMATGEVVGFLHSDDFFAHNRTLTAIAAAFRQENVDAVYADLVYVSKDNPGNIIRNWKAGEYKEGLFKKGWMPPHPTFFVKKEIYQRLGGFNTEFKISADYELMLRFIQKHGIRITYIPEVLVKMRVGGKSNVTLKNRLQANREDRKAWEVNGLVPGPFTTLLKPLSKIRQFF